MRKILYTALSLLLVSAVFTNCTKEGVFNPKNKISKVYAANNGTKFLLQEWTWDENLLTKMWDYPNDTTLYSYEKKQLSKVEMNGLTRSVYAEFAYNGKLYDKIDVYERVSKAKIANLTFTYDKKKVSKIVETIYATTKSAGSMQNNFLCAVIPTMILEETQKMVNVLPMQKANEDMVITHEMTYEKDNLKEWKISYTNGKSKVEKVFSYSSYDEKKCPYYASNPLIIDNGTSGDPQTPFFKNNPLKITCTQSVNGTAGEPTIYEYKYQYNKDKFPTEAIRKQMPIDFSDTTYYEYL